MDTKGRLIAGSHNRNEFVLINADEIGRVTSVKELSGQICQICGDEIELTVDGEPFVACNECAFPVCRPCYEYERREGNQSCPQCKTQYKRIKGSPRIEGNDDEEDVDDLDDEFDFGNYERREPHHMADAMLSTRLNVSRGSEVNSFGGNAVLEHASSSISPDIPLLTYGEEDVRISPNKHALIVPPFIGRGKRIHPMPFPDFSMSYGGADVTVQPRPMDPNKDLAVYGYGTIAWKERMEEWKRKKTEKLQAVKCQVGDGGSDGDSLDDHVIPNLKSMEATCSKIL